MNRLFLNRSSIRSGSILTIAALALSLSACGSDTEESKTNSSPTNSSSPSSPNPVPKATAAVDDTAVANKKMLDEFSVAAYSTEYTGSPVTDEWGSYVPVTLADTAFSTGFLRQKYGDQVEFIASNDELLASENLTNRFLVEQILENPSLYSASPESAQATSALMAPYIGTNSPQINEKILARDPIFMNPAVDEMLANGYTPVYGTIGNRVRLNEWVFEGGDRDLTTNLHYTWTVDYDRLWEKDGQYFLTNTAGSYVITVTKEGATDNTDGVPTVTGWAHYTTTEILDSSGSVVN